MANGFLERYRERDEEIAALKEEIADLKTKVEGRDTIASGLCQLLDKKDAEIAQLKDVAELHKLNMASITKVCNIAQGELEALRASLKGCVVLTPDEAESLKHFVIKETYLKSSAKRCQWLTRLGVRHS